MSEHERRLAMKAAGLFVCEECGRTFDIEKEKVVASDSKAHFCCHDCYVRLYMEPCVTCGTYIVKGQTCTVCHPDSNVPQFKL